MVRQPAGGSLQGLASCLAAHRRLSPGNSLSWLSLRSLLQASLSCLGKHSLRQSPQHAPLPARPNQLYDLTCRTTNTAVPRRPRPQIWDRQFDQPASTASAMSDLNSPEKPRSEPSLADSQPRSWSDVTLIEDITQESSSRHLSAHCLRECLESSSESVAEQPSPTEPPSKPPPAQIPAQAVCVVKRFRARSRSRGPGLPIAPASDTTPLCPAPYDTDQPRLLPLSRVPRPSLGLLPAPDTPASRRPTPPWSVNSIKRPRMSWDPQSGIRPAPQISYRARMPQPPSKGGLQPRFFAPPPRWSQHLLGAAVPKPRPLNSLNI